MNFCEYKDKVRACWLGKNIGGTLGMPFEGKRHVFDVDYYTHDLSEGVLPNDDLDLQLIWLNAAEKHGKALNAKMLATYWNAGVVAYWSEYGAAKNNIESGILPPASGSFQNNFRESNGAFIRSEIWACLAPGDPALAVKYAYEDACVDHAENGIYAELFCAALQSAAFTETNRDRLVEIALSYIPADCAVASAVKMVIDAYQSGLSWQETRKKILCAFPSTFGLMNCEDPDEDIPTGELGYDAPSNIALIVLGWLYGEGDFSKSICLAVNCGEDADCTAGTLAATFGILYGTDVFEERWLTPIGDEIKTIAINLADPWMGSVPRTVTNLTERVVRLMPEFSAKNIRFSEDGVMEIVPAEKQCSTQFRAGTFEYQNRYFYMYDKHLIAKDENPMIEAYLSTETLVMSEGETKTFQLVFANKLWRQFWAKVSMNLPEGIVSDRSGEFRCMLHQYSDGNMYTEAEFTLTANEWKEAECSIDVVISLDGYPDKIVLPVKLIRG